MIARERVSAYPSLVASFGENLRALRERANMTQEDVMRALNLKRSAPVSLMEGMRGPKVPRPATIKKVAAAVQAEPWELLEGVVTEIDRLKQKPGVPIRQGGVSESSERGDYGQTRDSAIGTEHAGSRGIPSRKAPDVEARLREEIDRLRAALDVFAKAVVAFGTPEAPEAPAVAPRKPRRRRRTDKRA